MIKTSSALSLCVFLWALALMPARALAQEFDFNAPAVADAADTSASMRDLAGRVLPVYEEQDRDRYLENLSTLQLVAGDYKAADDTRLSLRNRQRGDNPNQPIDRSVVLDLYLHARAMEADGSTSFAQAFTRSFQEVVPRLDDHDAYSVTTWLATSPASFRYALQQALDRLRGKPSITLPEAMELIRTYLAFDAYRSFGPLVDALDSKDNRRRYATEDKVLIKSSEGVRLYARLVRPKKSSERLPALLEFTIDTSQNDTRACAAHGYVGVVAYTRGKKTVAGRIVPFEYDGEDARAVISWIAKQPWSDGRVGMYGNGYSGFAAWAAAKSLPPELKAIATSDAMAPGIDFPMQGHIFRNPAYRWVTNNTQGMEQPTDDDAQWRALDQTWYAGGKKYRDLDLLAAKPNRIFRRWLNHPSYDLYWQKMIPFGEQFGKIGIPVLSTTGYYADGEAGALYYFGQHYRYKPDADHTLVVGPYDDAATRDEPSAVLGGYALDPAARVDLRELRYQWFDYVLKGGAKPSLLKDRVNYQVMGTNEWRYAPSLDAMANGALRFYLDGSGSSDRHRLTKVKSKGAAALTQIIDFAERADAAWLPPVDIVGRNLPVHNSATYVSEPLQQPTEVSGLLSGRLDFRVNKLDMDLNIALYELLPSGDYLQLLDPYEFRASYVHDRIQRKLIAGGKRRQLAFTSERVMSRKIQAGSRLVLMLGVNKRPDREINYGTGNDVSEGSVEDARPPMKVQWYGSSYVDVPIRK